MKYIILYYVGLLSLLIFIKGFFPVKYSPDKFATFSDIPPPPNLKEDQIKASKGYNYEPPVEKIIWIIVDAMRFDFIANQEFHSKMPYLQKLLETGSAKLYESIAKAPTVTMPRIKALTSGSITGFVDVLFNMNQSPQFKYDNIIHQLHTHQKEMVFYGDDTWLRLFPGMFKRKEGTTSFYVNDYTEVDNNVTRHIDGELDRKDWDVMVLHYLGLDHIGHLSGPSSLLVRPKLSEMDMVLHKICKKFLTKETNRMVVLTSDHGMSGSGSHGGTTKHEITTPLVIIRSTEGNNKFKTSTIEKVQQIDIAVSLSLAMGVPIPSSSMGKTITAFIDSLNTTNQLLALQYNCHQLLKYLSSTSNQKFAANCYRNALSAHHTFLRQGETSEDFLEAQTRYIDCQRQISDELSLNVASYNYPHIYIGLTSTFFSVSILLATWLLDLIRLPRDALGSIGGKSGFGIPLIVGTLLDVAMMGGSSFVEEQHQIWQFLTSSLTLALLVGFLRTVYVSDTSSKAHNASSLSLQEVAILNEGDGNVRKRDFGRRGSTISSVGGGRELWQLLWLFASFAALLCHRVVKSWNQTGIKYIEIPDIGDWLNEPQNNSILSLLSICSLLGLSLLLDFVLCQSTDKLRSLLTWTGFFCIYNYRHATRAFLLYGSDERSNKEATFEARLVYLIVSALLCKSLASYSMHCCKKRTYHSNSKRSPLCYQDGLGWRQSALDCSRTAVVMTSALLLRPHNHPVLALNVVLYIVVMKALWPVLVEGRSSDMILMKETSHGEGLDPLQCCFKILVAYWFGQHCYFSLGNSNGFATIDLSSAYVGLSSSEGIYNSILAVLLCTLATYVGPIVWMCLILTDIINLSGDFNDDHLKFNTTKSAVLSTIATIRMVAVSFYLAVVFGHRYHLFIWSVFAPKLLYEMVETTVFAAIISLAFLFWR